MSHGQIAVAAASAVLLVSLVVLAAAYFRRPAAKAAPAPASTPVVRFVDPPPTAPAVAGPAPPGPASAMPSVEDLLAMLVEGVERERRGRAAKKLAGDILDEGIPAEADRMRVVLFPKAEPAPK